MCFHWAGLVGQAQQRQLVNNILSLPCEDHPIGTSCIQRLPRLQFEHIGQIFQRFATLKRLSRHLYLKCFDLSALRTDQGPKTHLVSKPARKRTRVSARPCWNNSQATTSIGWLSQFMSIPLSVDVICLASWAMNLASKRGLKRDLRQCKHDKRAIT